MRSAGPARTFLFATALGLSLGLVVASAATLLAPRIASNVELDRQHNVLIAVGLQRQGSSPSRGATAALYRSRIVEQRLAIGDDTLTSYRALNRDGATLAHCIPVEGPGLWGPIRGFLGLDASATRVVGVTFYQHRETPGLGAAVGSPAWTAQWLGKSIVGDDGELLGIRIVKGAIDPDEEWEVEHAVDGISGATVTSRAVERLTRASLERYRPYLEEQWAAH